MRLFHFSEEADIVEFVPRPVAVPASRPPGMAWLNGPLVWAIDEWHQPLYLFPRDCPRILIWPTAATTDEDRLTYWPSTGPRMVAYVEEGWLPSIDRSLVHRYLLPPETFQSLNDAGMWVSRERVSPMAIDAMPDLRARLHAANVELRAVTSLQPLRALWTTSLHVSGIRLRNACDAA